MEKWSKDDIEKLKKHYRKLKIPSDQILKETRTLKKFTESFNVEFSPSNQFTPEDLADRLLKLRKSGKLPRVGNQQA